MRILIFGGNGWIGQQFVEIASKQRVHRPVHGMETWPSAEPTTFPGPESAHSHADCGGRPPAQFRNQNNAI